MKTILVTGCCGNIGASLVNYLLANYQYYNIVGIDSLVSGKINNIIKSENFKFYKIDCNFDDYDFIFKENDIEYIFHYAAYAGVERTLNNPFNVFNDMSGILNISRLASKYKIKKIAYSSSSEVYGEPIKLPLSVDYSPLNPRLPYAVMKLMGETILRANKDQHGTDYVIFRFFNTYSHLQSIDYVIPKFINDCLNNKDLKIFGDGLQTRSFLYIDDNLTVTTKIMFDPEYQSLNNSIINIGSSEVITIKELAEKIIFLTKSSSKIYHDKARLSGDARNRMPENLKFLQVLQHQPTNLVDGLAKVISYLL